MLIVKCGALLLLGGVLPGNGGRRNVDVETGRIRKSVGKGTTLEPCTVGVFVCFETGRVFGLQSYVSSERDFKLELPKPEDGSLLFIWPL